MLKKPAFASVLVLVAVLVSAAQGTKPPTDKVMVLPFENLSGQAEYNWVGESFAVSLSNLLRVPDVAVVSDEERKLIQQRLNIPLTVLPSLAAAIKMANDGRATMLVTGSYAIGQQQTGAAAPLSVTVKVVRVADGRLITEDPSGKRVTRDIEITEALGNLQTVHGQLAYQILYQRDRDLDYSQRTLVEQATRVPALAFEAYVKGLMADRPDIQTREAYFRNAYRIFAEEKAGAVYEDAALELGHVYLDQRRFQEALDYFSRVGPNARNYPEAAFYAGLVNFRQSRFEDALAVLKPLAEELKIASVLNTVGAIALHSSRLERKKNAPRAAALSQEATLYLSRAVQSSPSDADARFNLALSLFTAGSFAESVEHFRSVTVARPKDGEAFFLLAKALETLQDPTAAATDDQSRRLLTDNNRYAKLQEEWNRTKLTDTVNVRVLLPARRDFVGTVMAKRAMASEAVSVNEAELLLRRARELYKAGEDDKAVEVLRRVLFSEPMSAESYYLLGMINLRREETDKGIGNLKTALFWDNRFFDAFPPLIKIYIDRNECLQATNYFRSAQEVDPKRVELAGLQRQLERCSK